MKIHNDLEKFIYYEKMERILVVDNVYTWLNEDFTFLRHQLMICEIA